MIKRYLGILFVCFVTATYAQEEQKQTPKPTTGQVFSAHYARTYQVAIRYNDYDVAKHALYNLLVENPQNDSILYSLSLLYVQNQQYASAVLSANDILSVKPAHTGALEIGGISYENLGLKDKALERYETLYLNTDDFQTLYKIAFLQFDLKKYTECTTNIDILMGKKEAEELKSVYTLENNEQKEFPIKAALLSLKGMVLKEQGDKEGAKKRYNEALALAPDFPLAQEKLKNMDK
ncbi:hypothetical protein FNH22_01750 [Fulvivirga sp. M361]|uniref:tetratricopeptide repeat protein n=1 Tax=Fulvivirga sp. M361 TaxID=2594266 RepID=UPI00117B2D88|nr:hypothetical protein [Fulvivirga sp. M361]TRX62068.1 hypothetical protein FNH22_01750 [Fulvivirga sp. M361]